MIINSHSHKDTHIHIHTIRNRNRTESEELNLELVAPLLHLHPAGKTRAISQGKGKEKGSCFFPTE
jgi:hypothetical protein